MFALFRDGFTKDAVALLIVHILIGGAIAFGLAWAIDSYFDDTVSGLIGEYGENALIIHVRDDALEAAIPGLEQVMIEELPGSTLEQGVTLAGNANFFLSLPDDLKRRPVLESLSSLFSEVPGYNGQTLIIAPSVTIRSVHPSIRDELLGKVKEIDGVELTFRASDGIVALLESPAYTQSVNEEIETILEEDQILQVRFPLGVQLDSASALGDRIVAALRADAASAPGGAGAQTSDDIGAPTSGADASAAGLAAGAPVAVHVRNVTQGDQNDATAAFVKTLREMKQFLLGYATHVELPLSDPGEVRVGDRLALVANEGRITLGEPLPPDTVVAEVTRVDGPKAVALIQQGDISDLRDVAPGELAQGDAADGDVAQGAGNESPYAQRARAYLIDSRGDEGDRALLRLGEATLTNNRYRLARAVEESGRMLDELEGLSAQTRTAVEGAQETLDAFQNALGQLDNLQQQIQQLQRQGGAADGQSLALTLLLRRLFTGMGGSTEPAFGGLESLDGLDVKGMQARISELAQRVDSLQQVDFAAAVDQVAALGDSLPDLRDEEIAQSIGLIDQYIEGRVIPGEQVELLASASLSPDRVAAAARQALGGESAPLVYSMSVGLVEPDAQGILVQVLQQVRGTIAGLLSIAFTLLVFILDYATVASAMRSLRRRATGRRLPMEPATLLMGGVGAVCLTSIYVLSGADVPFVGIEIVVLIGLLLGMWMGRASERFSPVDVDEMMAGEALGLTYAQIMREIVIPSSRPGVAAALNRMWQRFRVQGSHTPKRVAHEEV